MKRLLLAPFLLFLLTSCADNLYKAKHICGKVGVEITYKKAMNRYENNDQIMKQL